MLRSNQIKWHWMMDWYDGPLAGLVYYQDKLHYAKCIELEDFEFVGDKIKHMNRDRLFELRSLTPRESDLLEARHNLFQTFVGRHWDFEDGVMVSESVNENYNYDAYSVSIKLLGDVDYENLPVVDTFCLTDVNEDDPEYHDQGYP